MQWENVPLPDQPPPKKRVKHGPITLHVEAPSDGKEGWLYFLMDFGRHTSDSEEESIKTWPALAISEARAALDDLERYLERNQ